VADDLLKKPVTTSKQVYELFKEMENEAREKVVCLHLSPQLEILSYELVGMGSAHQVLFDVSELFRGAVVAAARTITVVHNHPSGSLKPSVQDEMAVTELRKAAELLRIPLTDFIIIGDGYYSFNEEGRLDG
jgi:DNA repair protein RadC